MKRHPLARQHQDWAIDPSTIPVADPGPADPNPPGFIETQLDEIKVNPFNVHVDIVELLHHLDGDEQAMFNLLGKLKDFLS